jgi:quinol-cytochrome oxidoreductase complex cytochrome b subunit
VLDRRENEKRENKTRKPMHAFELIHALVSVFYFLFSHFLHSDIKPHLLKKNLHPTAARELNPKPKCKTTTQLEQREIIQGAETTNNQIQNYQHNKSDVKG